MLSLRRYTQPVAATWLEFLEHRGWSEEDTYGFTDEWLYKEWMRYYLRRKYHIGD